MSNKTQDLEEHLISSPPLGEIHNPSIPDKDKVSDITNNNESNLTPEYNDSNQISETETNQQNKNYRLAGRPPLITLIVLAIGPLISQFVSTIWVSRALGETGMAAVSLFTNLDNVGRAFGYFMNCSASQKISSLFGQKKSSRSRTSYMRFI